MDKLKYIIKRSLELKVSIVEKDQFEVHERKWLNFGHTIGHGI
jgi:3-dehydroquinate synthetase